MSQFHAGFNQNKSAAMNAGKNAQPTTLVSSEQRMQEMAARIASLDQRVAWLEGVLRARADGVEIHSPGKLVLKSETGLSIACGYGNSITFEPARVSVATSGECVLAGSVVRCGAGMLKVDAGMAKFSNAVQCSTIIATNVVGTSYTPGAGNIW